MRLKFNIFAVLGLVFSIQSQAIEDVPGDLNCDEKFDMSDVILISQYYMGNGPAPRVGDQCRGLGGPIQIQITHGLSEPKPYNSGIVFTHRSGDKIDLWGHTIVDDEAQVAPDQIRFYMMMSEESFGGETPLSLRTRTSKGTFNNCVGRVLCTFRTEHGEQQGFSYWDLVAVDWVGNKEYQITAEDFFIAIEAEMSDGSIRVHEIPLGTDGLPIF